MTNIDLSKIEYSSKIAGLKNSGQLDFNIPIPAQNLAKKGDPTFYFRASYPIDLKVKDQIIDTQINFDGLDSMRSWVQSWEEYRTYDSSYNLVLGTPPSTMLSVDVTEAITGTSLEFIVFMQNLSAAPIVTRAFNLVGTILLFDAPFGTSF